MDLKQAIYGRRSIRQSAGTPVGEEALVELINAAVQAPSAVNEQPWSFCVVRIRESLARLSREAKDYLMRTASTAAMSTHFRETLGDPANHIFHGAPVLIVIASQFDSVWATEDCALAAENLMLLAHSMGLGTCWIGSAQSCLQTPHGRAAVGLESHHRAVAPIIVGQPPRSLALEASDPHVPCRKTVEDSNFRRARPSTPRLLGLSGGGRFGRLSTGPRGAGTLYTRAAQGLRESAPIAVVTRGEIPQ